MNNKVQNFEMFKRVINNLSTSQGFYSRLKQQLDELTPDEINEITNGLPMFEKPIDVCLYLEQ